jgi:hypothetical protein
MTRFERSVVGLLAVIAGLLVLHLVWPRYVLDNGIVLNTLTGRAYTVYECRPQQSIFDEIGATSASGSGRVSAAATPAAGR